MSLNLVKQQDAWAAGSGRPAHRLPGSVWAGELVVGLNLSVEAVMSVGKGSGEDRDRCLF